MRARIRQWLGIEGQTWKHAVTSNNFGGMTVVKARVPTPPSEPGNWELIAVILSGYEYIFWWKAPADPGAPETEQEKFGREMREAIDTAKLGIDDQQ